MTVCAAVLLLAMFSAFFCVSDGRAFAVASSLPDGYTDNVGVDGDWYFSEKYLDIKTARAMVNDLKAVYSFDALEDDPVVIAVIDTGMTYTHEIFGYGTDEDVLFRDAVGNVVPFISHEEEKMETELAKMLGTYEDGEFRYAGFKVMANCARVPVVDGHLESLVLDMEQQPTLDELSACLTGFRGEPQRLGLPSAPKQPIIVRTEDNRPQPVFDAMAGRPARARGMAVTIGRLRQSNGYYKAFAMSHNTLRGGAGGSVLNAELAKATGIL